MVTENDEKGVELYINCEISLATNFWTNYQYSVDTTNLHKPTKIYHDNHENKCHLNEYNAVQKDLSIPL